MDRRTFTLSIACCLAAGCGGAPATRPGGEPGWPAHPPTESVMCGPPRPVCPHAASLRVRWPDDTHGASDAHVTLDGRALDVAEAELGACAEPGVHALVLQGSVAEPGSETITQRTGAGQVEIFAGVETRVALARSANLGRLDATISRVQIDTAATLAALAEIELPTIAYDATPEERRVFGPVLAAAFDDWRARLARVTELAHEQGDVMLRTAAESHESRANAIALTIAEERPSADRLVAILRAMRTEIDEAAGMIAVERSCPVYTSDAAHPALAPVSFDARPYTGPSTYVARLRVAVDDVEALDMGAADGGELFDHTMADGVVPPGAHVVRAEATFALRAGGSGRGRRVLEEQSVVVPDEGAAFVVRARDAGRPGVDLPGQRLVVEIVPVP